MKKNIHFALMLVFITTAGYTQSKNLSVKFNTGMSFSKPGGDLGEVATKGKAMQWFATAEAGYHLSFSKNTRFGVKKKLLTKRQPKKVTDVVLIPN